MDTCSGEDQRNSHTHNRTTTLTSAYLEQVLDCARSLFQKNESDERAAWQEVLAQQAEVEVTRSFFFADVFVARNLIILFW